MDEGGERLWLGAAGVPHGAFGSDDALDFEAGFAALAADGFDAYLPLFLLNESGASSAGPSYFLSPEALPGVAEAQTCAGPNNPWATNADLDLLLPAYLLVPEHAWSDALDEELFSERAREFASTCLGDELAALGGLYLYDEPASNAVGTRLDTDLGNDFRIENVAAMARASRAALPEAPLVAVEAALPFALPLFGVPPADRPALEAQWRAAVDESAPHADVYGFDLYPIDVTTEITAIGEYVELAREVAPAARPLAVLQGFGYADQGITMPGASGRRPTFEETRAMAYLAIVRGARALFWYGQSGLAVDDAQPWDDVRAVVRELRGLDDALAGDHSGVELDNATVQAARWRSDGEELRIAVNPSDQPQRLDVDGEAQELGPYGVLVLR